jgi:hypothetical protein
MELLHQSQSVYCATVHDLEVVARIRFAVFRLMAIGRVQLDDLGFGFHVWTDECGFEGMASIYALKLGHWTRK